MSKHRALTGLGRITSNRDDVKRILIISQGTETEPVYFEGLQSAEDTGDYRIEVIAKALDPEKLVEFALRQPKLPNSHQIWIVFDKDNFTDEQVNRALKLVKNSEKIFCAFSNPCFEHWILLHLPNWAGAITLNDIKTRIKRAFPYYENPKKIVKYGDVKAGVRDAIVRAQRIEGHHLVDDTRPPPCSCVWRLIQMILTNGTAPSCPTGDRNCVEFLPGV